jgi:small subunit ribosomal protein S1
MEDKDQVDAGSEVVDEEEEEDFATLLAKYEQSRPPLKPGQVVEGKIVGIYDNELLVDAGGRSEATLMKDEIKGPDGNLLFGMGDSISVMLEGSADSDIQLRVSYRKALRAKQLVALQESIDSGKNLEGRVVEVVKGGLLADVGMRGFIPASQVDESYVEDLKPYLGQTLTLKVMQHDLPNGKLILSRRALLNEARAKKRKETLATLAAGQRLPGIIRRILDYGAFVDIGGVEGLLHISEMSWRRIKHPSQLFKVGDHIEVAVLKYDQERCRISLGFRKPEDDPWRDAAGLFPEGTIITGTVKKLEHFGAFVELETGIQGLLPISEISWTRRLSHADQVLKVNDVIDALVTKLDPSNRKMSMSLKQVTEHPWEAFARSTHVDAVLQGIVTRTADFGLFVEVAEGVEGLVHVSELPETPGRASVSNYQPGEEIVVKMLGMDLDNRRISLSAKAVSDEEARTDVQEYLENASETQATGQALGESFPEELQQGSRKAE